MEEDVSPPWGEPETLDEEEDFLLPRNGMLIILIWTLKNGTPEGRKTWRDSDSTIWYFNNPVRQGPS